MKIRTLKRTGLVVGITVAAVFFASADKTLEAYRGLRPGDELPRAGIQSADGRSADTASWLGRETIILIYQPGCTACEAEIRNLAVVAPKFPGLSVVLLSLGQIEPSYTRPFPVYVDPSGNCLRRLRKLVVPTLYWISADGIVRYARTGSRSMAQEETVFRQFWQSAAK
jgi:hypothetical protein